MLKQNDVGYSSGDVGYLSGSCYLRDVNNYLKASGGKAASGARLTKAVAASGASSFSIDPYRACALPVLGGFG